MNIRSNIFAATLALCGVALFSVPAFAFCGIIQESGISNDKSTAKSRANNKVKKQVNTLRNQYGIKLVLNNHAVACSSELVEKTKGIEQNDDHAKEGSSNVSRPRYFKQYTCVVTRPFCVNP